MKFKRILKWSLLVIFVVLVGWVFVAYWTSTNDCDRYTAAPNNPMKAIVYCEYGPPEVFSSKKSKSRLRQTTRSSSKCARLRSNPLDGISYGHALALLGPDAQTETHAGRN